MNIKVVQADPVGCGRIRQPQILLQMFISDEDFKDFVRTEIRQAIVEVLQQQEPVIRLRSQFKEARFLTRRQVATYLGIGMSTVDYWVSIGKLTKIYINGSPRFDREEVDKSFTTLKKYGRAA